MKPHRSDKYQHLFHEVSVQDETLNWLQDYYIKDRRIGYSEEYKDLNEQAMAYVFALAKDILTDHQFSIFSMMKEGKTQVEIANILKCNQSCVAKAISGNLEYANPARKGKHYGGIGNRFKKVLKKDQNIKAILRAMRELEENDQHVLSDI